MQAHAPKQDKRHAQLEHLEARIARCHSRLFRVANVLDKLLKAKRRIEKAIDAELGEKADEAARAVKRLKATQSAPPPSVPVTAPTAKPDVTEVTELTSAGGFGITLDDPLDVRNAPWNRQANPADEAAKAAIVAEKAAKVKAKAADKRAAKKDRFAKKPLTGKEALAAIRGE